MTHDATTIPETGSGIATIEEAIAAIKAGRPVIVADDEDAQRWQDKVREIRHGHPDQQREEGAEGQRGPEVSQRQGRQRQDGREAGDGNGRARIGNA